MKRMSFLLPMLVLVGAASGVASVSLAADTGPPQYQWGGQPPPTPPPLYFPPGSQAGGMPGGFPGPNSYAGGCCQPPGPGGLHCCDTRDCGWFNCALVRMPAKSYR